MANGKPKLVVLGGAVMDVHFRVKQLPQWDQAIQAHSFNLYPGGKGLNQAIAAAKQGAEVSLISAVGTDYFGGIIHKTLQQAGVRDDFVQDFPLTNEVSKTAVTGVFVDFAARAAFVGWKSVTEEVGPELVAAAADRIREADALLITLEVSLQAVQAAVNIAQGENRVIVLNPAPPLEDPDVLDSVLLRDVSALVPNQWEAAQILALQDRQLEAPKLAMKLHEMGARMVCVTMSDLGCVVAKDGKVTPYGTAFRGRAADTTGASDAFCATLAICMAQGVTDDAKMFALANAAGAWAVAHEGGSPSMPTSAQLEHFMRNRTPVHS